MPTVILRWWSNEPETRERAQQHRYELIRRQVNECSAGFGSGSSIMTLADDRCRYECDFSTGFIVRNIANLLECDELTVRT